MPGTKAILLYELCGVDPNQNPKVNLSSLPIFDGQIVCGSYFGDYGSTCLTCGHKNIIRPFPGL